jgi:hypothetical protein
LRLASNRYRLKVNLKRRDARALMRDWQIAGWSAALARRRAPEPELLAAE